MEAPAQKMAKSKEGIKELKEVTEAILEISLRIIAILKDGYQHSDIPTIFEMLVKDEHIKNKISAAYEGISKVSGELKDLSIAEGVELSTTILQFIPQIIDLFKKDK